MKVTEISIVVTLEPPYETEYLQLLNDYFIASERIGRVSSIEEKKRLMAVKDSMASLCNRNPQKTERLNEMIDLVHGKREKMAIIAKSGAAAAELYEILSAGNNGKGIFLLSGDLSVHGINEKIDQFNKFPESTVLIMTDSASTGIDITAANHLVHYDYPSRYTDILQRNNRITRQTTHHAEAFIYYLYTSGKIDDFLYRECMREGTSRERAIPAAT
jgi:superfamily II DNA/RNA helicase